jgi:hypothetical protein
MKWGLRLEQALWNDLNNIGMDRVKDSVGERGPIPVAAPSKAWVGWRSLAGIVGSNPAGGMNVCLL